MNKMQLGTSGLQVSRISLGCMELGNCGQREPLKEENRRDAVEAIRTALDGGIDFFDHANIYGRGKCEQVFSSIWKELPHLRGQVFLQSKCGIRFAGDPTPEAPGRFDFSRSHILEAVEGSLRRLQTDYLDVLLLHRPDALVEPEQVAQAFDELHAGGKVRYFGVSNHTAIQIELLKRYVRQPLVVNQVELNILHLHLVDAGVAFNQDLPPRPTRNEDTLEYCRVHDITLQAWSPVARGFLTGRPIAPRDERVERAAALVAQLAAEKGVSREAIALAWLLRHPARIQPIIGTSRPDRIRAACQADTIDLSREEWYRLYTAGRGAPVP